MSIHFFSHRPDKDNDSIESDQYRYEIDVSANAPLTRILFKIYNGNLDLLQDELSVETSKKMALQLMKVIGKLV
jgi:hypothetical protein